MKPAIAGFLALAWLLAPGCGPGVRPIVVMDDARDAKRDVLAEEAVQLYFERQLRLTRVSAPIRIAGAPLCGDDVAPFIGIVIWRRPKQVSEFAFFEAANRLYGHDPGAIVVAVLLDSPAKRADVRSGDRIVEVNGEPVTEMVPWYKLEADFFDRFHGTSGVAPRLSVIRDGARLELTLEPIDACHWEAVLDPDERPYTGRGSHGHMNISTGMLRVAASDQELAAAVAHQLGHMIVGRRAYAKHEAQADRLGLFLLARAGYDPSAAPPLWERLTLDRPWAILFDGWVGASEPAHGRMPERMLTMRATLAEIEEKKARGEPLVPGPMARP